MSEIKLNRRYPESRLEDVTDAYMRGFEVGLAMRTDENAELRELVLHMHTCLEHYEPGDTISCELCPYDNETWGCDYERLMAELGIEVE